MTRECAVCGVAYAAQRSTSRYCSSSCRGQASKRRAAGLAEAFSASRVRLPAEPGHIRRDLARHIEEMGETAHPLTPGLLALADRLDQGSDPIAGMATALRQLADTLTQITGAATREPDGVDVLRLRHIVSRIDREKGERLREILDAGMVAALSEYVSGGRSASAVADD